MKCPHCGRVIDDFATVCPYCEKKISRAQRFKQKVKTENETQENYQKRKEKLNEKMKDRETKVIEKNDLKNPLAVYPVIFGVLGVVLILAPVGIDTQAQWWYLALIFACSALGYFFAVKANRVNNQYYTRYRVRVKAGLIKTGTYLCAFTLLVWTVMTMVVVASHFNF